MRFLFKYLNQIFIVLKASNSLHYKSICTNFFKWKRYFKNPNLTPIGEHLPWITLGAVDFLNRVIKPQDCVFEYGMGGSTLFWLDKGCKTYGVEHDKNWFELVKDKVPAHATWYGKLQLPQPIGKDKALVANYLSDDKAYEGFHFKNYTTEIEAFGVNSLDFVLVDGRNRDACLLHAIPKVKMGGYLILDNSDRLYYFKLVEGLLAEQFKRVDHGFSPTVGYPYFTQTTIWQKVK
jgi:hypothetical protein